MKGPARVACEPSPDLRVFVSGVVVDHGFNQLAGRDSAFDVVEETDELPMPVLLHAAADHLAIEDVERCEQRCGAVALAVVRHGTATARLERRSRLRAIERLDLALQPRRRSSAS